MRRNLTPTWKAKPFRIRLVLAWTSLALVLPLAATGCSHKDASAEESKRVTEVEVETTNPARKDLLRDIEQPGFLMPWEVTPIYTKIAGFAQDWKHDLGDRVKKDDLLVELYVPEVDLDLIVKEAKVDQAEADVTQSVEFEKAAKEAMNAAKADVNAKYATIHATDADVERWDAERVRSLKLFKDGVYDKATLDEVYKQYKVSLATNDEAKANYESSKAKHLQATANYGKATADVKVAKAGKRVADAAYKQWDAWLAYKYIRAPYDGLVTLRNVAKGDFLQPTNSGSTSRAAEPLFIMMRTDVMRCTIEVPELDALLLNDGDAAEIRFDAIPGAPTMGTVKRNSGALDSHSRTLRVEVHLQNPDHKYKPNMYLKILIKAKLKNTWSLPATLVLNDILQSKDRRYCFVVEDGIARKTFLEVGEVCEDGLMPIYRKQRAGSKTWETFTGKEAVVSTNAQALLDGQKVTVKAAASH